MPIINLVLALLISGLVVSFFLFDVGYSKFRWSQLVLNVEVILLFGVGNFPEISFLWGFFLVLFKSVTLIPPTGFWFFGNCTFSLFPTLMLLSLDIPYRLLSLLLGSLLALVLSYRVDCLSVGYLRIVEGLSIFETSLISSFVDSYNVIWLFDMLTLCRSFFFLLWSRSLRGFHLLLGGRPLTLCWIVWLGFVIWGWNPVSYMTVVQAHSWLDWIYVGK